MRATLEKHGVGAFHCNSVVDSSSLPPCHSSSVLDKHGEGDMRVERKKRREEKRERQKKREKDVWGRERERSASS